MTAPTYVLLSRHGETMGNADKVFSGHSDVDLTPLGRRQAAALGARLQGRHIDAAYASDLSRTRITAELALCDRGIAVQLLPGLREIHFGSWEGRTFPEIRAGWPEAYHQLLAVDDAFCPPAGEPLAAARRRVVGAMRAIVSANMGKTVLVVAHGGTIQLFVSDILGMASSATFRLSTGNCGLSEIAFYGKRPALTLFNDCRHVELLAAPETVSHG